MPRLTQRTRDARRHQILDAARRCFTRTGFQATSMQDIFSEAGLSAGAVYSHFAGKDEIIAAIGDEVIAQITSAFDTAATAGDPSTLDDVLEQFFTKLQNATIAPIAISVWAEAVRDPVLRRRLTARYRQMQRNFIRVVRNEQQRGSIDHAASAQHVAQVLTGLGPAFLHQRTFDTTVTAATFARGLRGILRQP
jgi:AcrR family transcriptional regulator